MSEESDLVQHTKLDTLIRSDGTTIHTSIETDEEGKQHKRREYWRGKHRIGSGATGRVFLQGCVKGGGPIRHRAVKELHRPQRSSLKRDLQAELETLAKFSHGKYRRWFVQSFGWYEDQDSIFVAMEYCRLGDLQSYLGNGHSLTLGETKQLTCQMLGGLEQMHMNNYVHRDLKPKNILIKSMPPYPWWIVLADFGISQKVQSSPEAAATRGTFGFMAPELLGLLDSHVSRNMDFKASDIWAAGEIIVRWLTDKAAFDGIGDLGAYCSNLRPGPSSLLGPNADESCRDFIDRAMAVFPAMRITAGEALSHLWLEGYQVFSQDTQSSGVSYRSTGQISTQAQSETRYASWTSFSTDHYARASLSAGSAAPRGNAFYARLDSQALSRLGHGTPQYNEGHPSERPRDVSEKAPQDVHHSIEEFEDDDGDVASEPDTDADAEEEPINHLQRSQQSVRATPPSQLGAEAPAVQAVALSQRETTTTGLMERQRPPEYQIHLVTNLPKQKGRIKHIVFSPNNSFFVTLCLGGPTKLWKVLGPAMRCRHLLTIDHVQAEGHEDTAVFSQDSKVLAMRVRGARLGLWSTSTLKRLKLIDKEVSIIKLLAISPDSSKIAAIQERMVGSSLSQHTTMRTKYTGLSSDLDLKIWDIASGKVSRSIELNTVPPVKAVWFSADGKEICVHQKWFWNPAVWPEAVFTWKVATGQLLSEFPIPCSRWDDGRKTIRKDMAVSEDYRSVTCVDVSTKENQTVVSSWHVSGTTVALQQTRGYEGKRPFKISPGGHRTGILHRDLCAIHLFDAASENAGHWLSFNAIVPYEECYHLTFSPDGRFLVLQVWWMICVWNIATGVKILSVGLGTQTRTRDYPLQTTPSPVSFSPDGTLLLAEDKQKHIINVWRVV